MARKKALRPEDVKAPSAERREIYAVRSDRGDSTGPLTEAQAEAELRRLQADSDERHSARLEQTQPRVQMLPPPHYEIVELAHGDRLAYAARKARPKGQRGFGDEEVGE